MVRSALTAHSQSGALISHLVSYNIQWSSTIKEVEMSNFFEEIPRILKRFWATFAICIALFAAMIVLALPFVPRSFRVGPESWSFIFPLA